MTEDWLEQEQCTNFPHRSPRLGTANAKERNQTAQRIPSLFAQQTDWLDKLPDCTSIPQCTQLPAFLVVHLSSGRRRITHIHAKLEEFAHERSFRIQVLSMDTAVSIFHGNLQVGHDTWRFLSELYKAGKVSATICGSPCKTFAAARHHQPEPSPEGNPARWPRPLRSAVRLFGLEGLTARELRQAAQGAEFFMQGVIVAAWALQFGGVYLSEHPWKPEDEAR